MVFWLVLCLVPRPLAQVSNACSTPRSTVTTLSTPQPSGLSSFHASCILPLWVRILPLQKPTVTVMLWTDPINVGMGIMELYFQYQGCPKAFSGLLMFGVPYLSISASLNILLTLMIVIRLALHSRNIHAVTGSPVRIGGLCKEISTMLIESCAIFTVSSLAVIGALIAARKDNPDAHLPGI